MRRFARAWTMAAFLGLAVAGSPASAEIGTLDDVPAATLLLPYFEVDLDGLEDATTLFSVNNASATAVIAHVTFWTDESVPTLDFDLYLTGYDVVTINLRDVFNGDLPVTASNGQDPVDAISPQGPISQDINFATCTRFPYVNPILTPALIAHLRAAHTGNSSPLYGGCVGHRYGDSTARGYITVDTVNACNLSFPDDAGYFGPGGLATSQNVLWGDYFYMDIPEGLAQGDTLVHIEACTGSTGVQPGCPFVPGDYTFYGRYVSGTGIDQREALATQFAAPYDVSETFDAGTDLVVWRDAKLTVGAAPHACPGNFGWVPLNQADVVAFDREENPVDLCFQGDNVSPPTGGDETCFPLETQRVSLDGGNNPGADPAPPADSGWIFLNLNTTVVGGVFNPTAQAFVSVLLSAEGRYGAGYDAIQLDQANATLQSAQPGGVLLIP